MSLPVARLFGTEFRLHVSWILVLAMIIVGLGSDDLPNRYPGMNGALALVAGAVVAALYLASVLAHEIAHAATAQRMGGSEPSVVVQFFGAVTPFDRGAGGPRGEALIAAAGPLASLAIAAAFGLVAAATDAAGGALGTVAPLAEFLAVLNLAVAGINLVPGFPLDGGRLVRAVAWWRTGDPLRATSLTARTGRALGLAMVTAGVMLTFLADALVGLLVLMSGWFLRATAGSILRQVEIRALLAGVTVGDAMREVSSSVGPALTVDAFADQVLVPGEPVLVSVVDDGTVLGLIGPAQLRRVRRARWPATRAADAMAALASMPNLRPDDPIWTGIEHLQRTGFDGLPVMDGASLLGLVTRASVASLFRDRLARGRGPA